MSRPDDAFTEQIIQHQLTAVSDEMFATMRRASMSPIIYETLDYAVGITDPEGGLIAQGNGVTGFLGALDQSVVEVLSKHGDPKAGDVFIANDPYSGGGTHPSDVTVVMPVVAEGALVAFVANKAHWTELGGKDPGSWSPDATEVFQEGLRFPNIALIRRGQVSAALVEIIAANVRLPDMTLGDLWAAVAALRIGERRLVDICRRYGVDRFTSASQALIERGELLARSELASLPQGVFEATDVIDEDGFGSGPLDVKVKVTIADRAMTCDFSGSHPQVRGPINGTRGGLVSSARTVYRALLSGDVPTNAGAFKPLEVVCPDRTVFTAETPAPVSTYWESLEYASDLIWKALAPHAPKRLPAGHFLSVCGTILSGTHPDTKEPYLLVEPLVGGWGAAEHKDGESGQFCAGDGETYNIPIEVTETRYGVLVDQYAFHDEEGGAGRFRGGRGVVLDYRVLGAGAHLSASFGRHKHPPWGVAGGAPGSCNRIELIRRDGSFSAGGKVARAWLEHGDVARLVTGHGAGYGSPAARARQAIAADVKNGIITAAQAARDYGDRGLESLEPKGQAQGAQAAAQWWPDPSREPAPRPARARELNDRDEEQ